LALASREYKLPNVPRLKLPQFSVPTFFGEETIILEGDNEELMKAQEVKKEFNKMTEKLSGVYGLYVIRLDSGYSYGVNETDDFTPASLNKLPAIVGIYIKAGNGEIGLNDPYILKNSDKLPGSGILRNEPAGKRLTNRELVKFMGKDSDNTAYNISRKIIAGSGWEKWVSEFAGEVGMEKSVLTGEAQKTTPRDIGIFFHKLYKGEIVKNKEHVDEIYGHLTNTSFEDWLSEGVPSKVQFAHKYGREIHVVNDAGIVFASGPEDTPSGGRDYIVVLLTKGIIEKEADKVIPEIAQMIFDFESKD
jgi:beta-lactamase class A